VKLLGVVLLGLVRVPLGVVVLLGLVSFTGCGLLLGLVRVPLGVLLLLVRVPLRGRTAGTGESSTGRTWDW